MRTRCVNQQRHTGEAVSPTGGVVVLRDGWWPVIRIETTCTRLALALALVACRRTPAPTPTPPPIASPAIDAGRAAADAPAIDAIVDVPGEVAPAHAGALEAACAALAVGSLARWDAVVRAHGTRSVPVIYGASSRPRVRQRWECVRVADGAWALSLEAATLSVVFVRPDGTTVRATPPGCAVDPAIPGFSGTVLAPQPRVGDGPARALVTCDNQRGAAITVAADGLTVAPLPFAGADVRLDDVDRDGLVDVLAALGGAAAQYGSGAVTFVAHATPDGGFALDDEVARVALRGQCPEQPTALLSPARSDLSFDDGPNAAPALARRVMCARVWGVPVAAIAALIDRAEAEGPPTDPTADPVDAGMVVTDGGARRYRIDRTALLALANSARPPLRLRPMALPPVAAAEPSPDAGTAAVVVDAGESADAGAPAWPRAVARVCAEAGARVQRLTSAEITRAGESLTDAGTDNIDGRPTARRMTLVRRSLGRCVAARGGAWVLALRSLERGAVEGGSTVTFRARWAADFVTSAGARVPGPEREALVDEGCDHDELGPVATSDLDGDGRGELALASTHFWCGDGDGDNRLPVTVLTARGDRVEVYPPFAAIGPVQSFVDFDRDGRLDLVDEVRWGSVECDPAGVGVDDSPGPLSLWHALPDGSFSRADAVARAFLRRGGCSAAPTRMYAAAGDDAYGGRDGSDALFRGVCARAHGWSAERVQLQALADLRALGPAAARFRCNDLEWLSWRILIGPPTR